MNKIFLVLFLSSQLFASYIGPSTSGGGGGGGGTPAIPNNSIQFNNSGAFGGSSNLIWNGTSVGVNQSSPQAAIDSLGFIYTATPAPASISAAFDLTGCGITSAGNGTSYSYAIWSNNNIPLDSEGVYSSSSASTSINEAFDPSSAGSTINYGSGSYTADGSTHNFAVHALWDSSSKLDNVPSTTSVTDDNSSNPYSIALTWSTPGYGTPDKIEILRTDDNMFIELSGSATSYNDDNTGWAPWPGASSMCFNINLTWDSVPGADNFKIIRNSTYDAVYANSPTTSAVDSGFSGTDLTTTPSGTGYGYSLYSENRSRFDGNADFNGTGNFKVSSGYPSLTAYSILLNNFSTSFTPPSGSVAFYWNGSFPYLQDSTGSNREIPTTSPGTSLSSNYLVQTDGSSYLKNSYQQIQNDAFITTDNSGNIQFTTPGYPSILRTDASGNYGGFGVNNNSILYTDNSQNLQWGSIQNNEIPYGNSGSGFSWLSCSSGDLLSFNSTPAPQCQHFNNGVLYKDDSGNFNSVNLNTSSMLTTDNSYNPSFFQPQQPGIPYVSNSGSWSSTHNAYNAFVTTDSSGNLTNGITGTNAVATFNNSNQPASLSLGTDNLFGTNSSTPSTITLNKPASLSSGALSVLYDNATIILDGGGELQVNPYGNIDVWSAWNTTNTTDNTPATLLSISANLSGQHIYDIEVQCLALRTSPGIEAGDWDFKIAMLNNSGTMTIINTTYLVQSVQDGTWVMGVGAGGGNVIISGTGGNSDAITWNCRNLIQAKP